MSKSEQLQIRVTKQQKLRLKKLAAAAGMDVSAYVLARVEQPERDRFAAIIRRLARGEDRSYVFAELNEFLADLPPTLFPDATELPQLPQLDPYVANYVAAMVEHAATSKGVRVPDWVNRVDPLDEPHFAVPLRSLRPHLLAVSPVAFKRRNIFVSSTVGDRV